MTRLSRPEKKRLAELKLEKEKESNKSIGPFTEKLIQRNTSNLNQ